MGEFLYKVSAPRAEMTFTPTRFWRTHDWSSSTRSEREGYLQDEVLYAAEFDVVNIHLLPKVWRLRVWLDDDARREGLRALGFAPDGGAKAAIFTADENRDVVESFVATVYTFDAAGFERTPSDEFISRVPRTAMAREDVAFLEAKERWGFDLFYVPDVAALERSLQEAGIDHQIQT